MPQSGPSNLAALFIANVDLKRIHGSPPMISNVTIKQNHCDSVHGTDQRVQNKR